MHMVVLLCLSSYVASTVGQEQPSISTDDDDDDNYSIILDAGSSGTKLKIYKWHGKGTNNELIELTLELNKKIKPSISEFAYNYDGIVAYFKGILVEAEHFIPQNLHSTTPVYLLATAGLRIFPSDTTEALLEKIESVLGNKTINAFQLQSQGVRVISGEEEGVYAWIAANYLRGFFKTEKPPNQAVGVLEMGGGSTQIAFLPDGPIYANMYQVRIFGRTFNLYAHSYLFYGQNYMISRINDYLIRTFNDSLSITNPCMLSGDNTTVLHNNQSVHIYGSSDTTQCLEIIDVFLRPADDHFCYPKPCAIGRTYQPEVDRTTFLAISAFVYSPRYLKAVDDHQKLNVTLLRENAILFCQKNLTFVTNSGLSAEYASAYCTMGLYIPSLLVDAYGFTPDSTVVYVKSTIDGTDIDWAMGAMLLELDRIDRAERDICDTSSTFRLHASAQILLYLAIVLLLLL